MRNRDFNRVVKQLRKAGFWDPVGAAKDIVRIAQKEQPQRRKKCHQDTR